MKVIPIFVGKDSEEGIWAIQLPEEKQNEFDKFFARTTNVGWLRKFFSKNYADLTRGFFGKPTIEDAVVRTMKEAQEMEDILYDYTEQGIAGRDRVLQHLFKPLNNFEYTIITHQKSKARFGNGWARLYAIRLSANCYLVTGGAIKLTLDMTRDHLQDELIKLERAKLFLRDRGIDFPEDLNTCQDE